MAPRVLFGTRLEETKFDITTVDDGPPSRHGVCAEEGGGGGGGGGGFFLACGDSGEDWTNHSTSTVQKEKKKKKKWSSARSHHSHCLGQEQFAVAQRVETMAAVACDIVSLIGSHTTPGQHNQPAPT